MNIVFCPELSSVVIAPHVNSVFVVEHVYESAPHRKLFYAAFELCLYPGIGVPTFKERRPFLNFGNGARKLLKVLNKPIGRSGAERPSPEKDLFVGVDNHILAVVHLQIPERQVLEIGHCGVVVNVFEFIVYA